MVATTAIADSLYRGGSVRALLSAVRRPAFRWSHLTGCFLLGLISLTKTNGAASDAGGTHIAIARLQRRSSNDN